VPQAFTKAYCQAWLNPDKPHYLIIEEINRGNCAQIFGDLFQCLDRDETGKSKYEIDCDKDLADYLKKSFAGKGIVDDKIILPSNLYIYATMNTSDQSLFPMDSAFKRRWDWEFVPIDYDDAKQITIEVDAASKYNWSNFIKNINPKIKELTGSEDKQLGNRFVNPNNKKITLDQFKSKILFYLWSEIYKDEFGTQNSIFKYEENGETKDFQFGELYNDNSTELVKAFLKFNGIEEQL
jgi:5-methylcytosine-specific restriction endonuclease McrBC GTP-binding regulatory subunit McrB